jgi:hypothetical protein
MNKDKYTIGEIVTLKNDDGSVIIFEYLGRGLNGYLKLKNEEKYVEISEKYELIRDEPTIEKDEKNQFRRMVGRYIHSYGFPDQEWFEYELEQNDYTPDVISCYLEDMLFKTELSQEDLVKLFVTDTNLISEIMDKYLPVNKEKNCDEYGEDGLPACVIFHNTED